VVGSARQGRGDACPILAGERYLDWALEDPAGKGVDAVRPIGDEIETWIRDLLESSVGHRAPGAP